MCISLTMKSGILGAAIVAAISITACGGSDDEAGGSAGAGTGATGGSSGGGGSGGSSGSAGSGAAGSGGTSGGGGSAGQSNGGSAGASAACTGSAMYTVSFDAAWSAATHPTDFPSSAHWSPLIGATHNASVSLWKAGATASDGIEQMAESGGTTLLKGEISAAQGQGTVQHLLSGSGVNPSPGQTSLDFENQQQPPLGVAHDHDRAKSRLVRRRARSRIVRQ